jgi:cytosine/adenosine deaminase-related metal-dependent hydrolase
MSAWAGAAEALLAGTTTIVDHHASPGAIEGSLDGIDEPLEPLGIRRVLCYEVTDRDGSRGAAAGLEESRRHLEAHSIRAGLHRGMVGAHASFTLSDETLRACVDLARELDVGIHVHVAEDAADQEDAHARFGTRVVDRLADAGALDHRALLAHCVHVDEREIARIHETGAWVAHNPRSNMNNRVGRAPVVALGERVALGTDGIDGDLFAESKAAFWRGREDDRDVTPAWVLGRVASGAAFAGAAFREPLLGRIEPGAPADLVVLAYDPPTPVREDNLAGHWIFGISARHVRDVLVAGEIAVRDRRLARGDEEHRAIAQSEAVELWDRMDRIPPHPFEPAGRS